MLDGLDTTWQAETQQTEMNYPYLKPGTYTFKLIAKNHEGTWNSVPSSIQFTIEPPFWQTPWFILSVIVLLVVSIYGFILWRERNHRLERIKLEQTVNERTWELAQKNDELAARNNDIMDSIRYAKRIQTAVMPTTQTFEQYLPEHFVFFRPRDIVSGDYYWLGRMGNRTLFTAVDCTGHGVPGAFLSMLGIAFLNEIVSRNPEMTAADILGQLRAQIISSLKQTGQAGGSQDGMDMALCIIDEQSHTVQFSGANNPLLLYRNDEEALMYKADKMPIGIYQGGQREFTNHTINYQTGDTVYVFSDGYPDQFGEKTNRKYMRKRFKEFLQTIQSYDMQRQQQLIVTEFDSWKGTRDQIDDVLVIGVRL
jgi:serine phosphatase RsbU (regulator of sigma subunit)